MSQQTEGYLHPLYAQSFTEIGEPIFLPNSMGWLIKRQIPATPFFDGMGPYPLFFCNKWDCLINDIEALNDKLISVSLVLSPFSVIPHKIFKDYFDIFYPYKDHYLLDLSLPLNLTISKNKRRNANRALREVSVELVKSPNIDPKEWFDLYQCLLKRHNIQGIRRFSYGAFEKQIAIPNTYYFRAIHNNKIVGGNIFYIQGDIAYAHLSAFTEVGYEKGAPYAIKWVALNSLSGLVRWVNFGGSPDKQDGIKSGLDLFKSGWSNKQKSSLLCGKILNHTLYHKLIQSSKISQTRFFPVYRKGD